MVKEQQIPIADIATSRFQGRRVGDISTLAESIRKNGLINPIHVWDTGAGLELLCGQRRLGAHEANGETDIRAYVYSDISNTKAAVLHWTDNERKNLGYYEQAMTVGLALGWDGSDTFVDRKAFLGQIGLSSPRAKRLHQLWRLVPEVGEFVDSGAMTQTEGIEISRLEQAEQLPMAEEYLIIINTGGGSPSRDMEFLKKAVAGKLPEKPGEQPSTPTETTASASASESVSPEPAEREPTDSDDAAMDAEVANLPDDDQGEPERAKGKKAGTETVEYGECHDRMRLVMSPKDWIITVKVPRGSGESRPTQDINQAFGDKDGGRSGLHLMLSYVDMAAKMAREKAEG